MKKQAVKVEKQTPQWEDKPSICNKKKLPNGKKTQEEPGDRGGAYPPLSSLMSSFREWMATQAL